MSDQEYMKMAIELAVKGGNRVSPNPLVGAVIVKDGEIIGYGYHEKYGMPHAEINALNSCTKTPEGATMYVTLEPCCHIGKTPPCTDAIIQSKIKRVVIGSKDPNPLVGGKGIEILKASGIEVTHFILEKECVEMNKIFFHYIETGRPYVVMKYAMTLDGKIATFSGKSKWITGDSARNHVHKSRSMYSAIMVGSKTVITDDPELTSRIPGGRNPKRIICDTNLSIPLDARVLKNTDRIETYIATASIDKEKIETFRALGCHVLSIPKYKNHISLDILMKELAKLGIDSILLEGGGELNSGALEAKIVNKLQIYIAPKIFGGKDAKTPVGGVGIDDPQNAISFKRKEITMLDQDILVEYEV